MPDKLGVSSLSFLLSGNYDTSTATSNLCVVLSNMGKLLDDHSEPEVTRQTVCFHKEHTQVDCITFAAAVTQFRKTNGV